VNGSNVVFIRKPIDVISPADGKHYTSVTQYEKALDRAGQHILSEREFKNMREKCGDEALSQRKEPEKHNHVHIDLNNGRVEKTWRDR